MLLAFLQDIDYQVFHFINSDLTNLIFDAFFPFLTNFHRLGGISFACLLFCLFWIIYKTRRQSLLILVSTLITIGVCDLVSYRMVKKSIGRPRPHHLAELNSQVRISNPPGDPSFTSNHATNTAGAATLLLWFFPQLRALLIPLVFLIGISRVYVGVHFPSDIIGGWLLGFLIASLIKQILSRSSFLKAQGLLPFQAKSF